MKKVLSWVIVLLLVGCASIQQRWTQSRFNPIASMPAKSALRLNTDRPIQMAVYFARQKHKTGFSPVVLSSRGEKLYIFSQPIFRLDRVVTVRVDKIQDKYYVRLRLPNALLDQIRREVKRDKTLGYVITANDKIISLKGLLGEHSFLFEVRNEKVAKEIKERILRDTKVLSE